jgi:hypothetical protein
MWHKLGLAAAATALLVGVPVGIHAVAKAPAATCSGQHDLDNPTNSTNKALDGYSFDVNGTTVCSLFSKGAVKAGDTVTASITPAEGVSPQVTLLVNKTNGTAQTLLQCASVGLPDDGCSQGTLNVTLPSCGFQVDLIYGPPSQSINRGAYAAAHVWINGTEGDKSVACPPPTTPAPPPAVPGTGGAA